VKYTSSLTLILYVHNYVVTKTQSALVSSKLSICFRILLAIPSFLFHPEINEKVGKMRVFQEFIVLC